MSLIKEIHVPDIGDFKGVDVIEVLVAAGDVIEVETPLIILETDKASMEVPSPVAGVVREVKLKPGDKISEGDMILYLEVAEAVTAPKTGQVAPPVPATGSKTLEVRVPDIGDFKGVPVIEIMVAPGDHVDIDTPLIVLESDKANMDVPSPFAGTVQSIERKVGDKVSQGDLILLLVSAEADTAARPQLPDTLSAIALGPRTRKPEAAPPPPPVAPLPSPPPDAGKEPMPGKVHASPSIRRFARELGVDLTRVVTGSGPKGRILKEDVQGFVKQVMSGTFKPVSLAGEGGGGGLPAGYMGIPPIPPVDFAKFGPVEIQPLSRIKKLSGANLHRAWLNVPHVTHHDEADITEVDAFRQSLAKEAEQRGVRVTMLSFLLKACAAALKTWPNFNASLDATGENLVLKKYCHIGVAVDTPDGLVVPVIRDVDQKSIFALSAELGELSIKARNKKLGPGEMQGACFTISSLGGIGGIAFTPIVNAPEVAILGVTRSQMKPVWNGKEFTPRLLLPLSLSYDHRVIDGAQAARFAVTLAGLLADIRRLLL